MSPRSRRPAFPSHLVTAVVVCHDGAEWLPDALAALGAQRRPPQRVVAVDTGSADGSAELAAAALGESAVVRLARTASLGAAVQAGLDAFRGAPAPPGTTDATTHWVWVLHDDCAPEPGALEELLRQAEDAPSVVAFGPKIVGSDGRRLIEVGRTIDSSGRVQTGIEPRELDQGQHDDIHDVLAVGTAGLLVRRDVWDELGGLARTWPLYAEDIDFGWRVNAAGHPLRVVPAAVVRHHAALADGQRAATAVRGRPGAARRRHGMQVVLANTSALLVPLLLLRYLVESVLTAAALLLFERRPGAAYDEVLAFIGVLARPRVVLAARRRRSRTVSHRELRPLLAAPALRWRHLADAVAETFGGGGRVEERRRRRVPVETGPVAAEAESMDHGASAVLTALRRPAVLLFLGLTAVSLIACRHLLSTSLLHGGRMLPAPLGASDLWSTYRSAWHPVGLGSTTVAPPALALLAAWSTLWLGNAPLAITALLVGAVPLAGIAAFRASRSVTTRTRLRIWAAVVYATLPVATGAISGGRVDVVAAVVLLPLCVRSVVRAALSPVQRWDRWVRAGLLLAVVTAFAPVAWVILAVLAIASAGFAGRALRARLAAYGVVFGLPLLLLLPWTATVVMHPRLVVAGGGLAEFVSASRPPGPADVLLAHPGGPAQPWVWAFAPILLAALIGVLRTRGAALGRMGLGLALAGMAAAIVVSRIPGPVPGDDAVRYWTGVPAAFVGLGCLVAAVVAADRARGSLRRHSFGWRQPAAALLTAAVLAATGLFVVGWVVRGAQGPLTTSAHSPLPVFATAQMAQATSPRVLVLRASGSTVRYALVRDPAGPRLGDADVAGAASSPGNSALAGAVQDLAAGTPASVSTVAEFGVGLVVVPGQQPAALNPMSTLDGLTRVPTSGAVVWRIEQPAGELVVIDPPAAADVAAGRTPVHAPVHPLPAAAGGAVARVDPGPSGRLLVLAEPASADWRASIDGRSLPTARAYGWAQAWQLPAAGGRVVVARTADPRPWWLLLELVLVVTAVLLSLPTRRQREDPGVAMGEPS